MKGTQDVGSFSACVWQPDKHDYDSRDTCGATECDREARYQAEAERAEAHEQLDRDMGW